MKRFAINLAWLYVGITFSVFLGSAIVNMIGFWPSQWRVPWSDLGSFVETKDGILLVSIRMWGRIELYDRSGKFLESWRQPFSKGDLALATDENGDVYFRHADTVFQLGAKGHIEKKYTADSPLPRNWELSEQSGEPHYAPNRNQFIERKIVKKGQILFSDHSSGHFLCSDGTHLVAHGSSLDRVTPAGQRLQTYRAPRYYWPLQFPVPGLLAWILGAILVYFKSQKEKQAA